MKIKEVLLGVIIAAVFFMFCVFGTKLIYDIPKYENYCDSSKMNYPTAYDKVNLTDAELRAQQEKYDAYYSECSKNYDSVNRDYSKKMFIISLIFGIAVIIFCTLFIDIGSITGGLMLGSLIFIIYGTGKYWNYMDDLLRFIVLGLALGILIYVAYWANKKSNNIKQKTKQNKK